MCSSIDEIDFWNFIYEEMSKEAQENYLREKY